MGDVVVDLSVSLDGFVAGSDDGPGLPLGRGGDHLFRWMGAGPESTRVEAGVRLLDHLGPDPIELEQTRVIESEGVTHLRCRVVRG